MIRRLLPLLCVILLVCCKPSTVSTDYLGQTHPDTTPVIFAPDLVSVKGRLEHGISFTSDTRELAFGLLDERDFSGEIYYAEKSGDEWTEPTAFEPLAGGSVYLPYFSPDGKSMLYAQSSSDTNVFVTDIWVLHKNSGNWSDPEKVGSPISSLTREASACMTLDNNIYFSSNRNGNGLADLYSSSLDDSKYLNAERIDAICTERDEESIFVSPDERYLIFSRYATDENGPDLFISYRDAESNWTEPRLLDAAINTSDWERRPFVSMDNKFLFFTKLTMNQSGIEESDIYWISTQKVFKPFVFNPITERVVKAGEETELAIPSDYFGDIDSENLTVSLDNKSIGWAKLDSDKTKLIMNPTEVGVFELTFTAIDEFLNETSDRVKITVD